MNNNDNILKEEIPKVLRLQENSTETRKYKPL